MTRALSGLLADEYGIRATAITPAARGYYGETWDVRAADGARYFVKIDPSPAHQPRFEAGLQVVAALESAGIDCVGHVVPTTGGALWAHDDRDATVGVFDWIDGANVESDDTKPVEYHLLAGIYAAAPTGLAVPTADFSTARADAVMLDDPLLGEHTDLLEHRLARFHHFAEVCRADAEGFVLTHGDAGGNLMADGRGRYAIVDWDEARYAPPERDAWVMAHLPWARQLFDDMLAAAGIDYRLRDERLAYCAYELLFFYLSELMAQDDRDKRAADVNALLGGWIEDRLRWADRVH